MILKNKYTMELAIEIWNEHIEVFEHFDLVCHNGHSLEDETKSNALFNALVTLNRMSRTETNSDKLDEINKSIKESSKDKGYSGNSLNYNTIEDIIDGIWSIL